VKGSVQYLRRLAIFNNLAEIHDSDIITHMLDDGEIMVNYCFGMEAGQSIDSAWNWDIR